MRRRTIKIIDERYHNYDKNFKLRVEQENRNVNMRKLENV